MDFKGPCHEPGPTVGGTLSIHNLIHVGFVVHEMAIGLFCQSVLFHRHYKLNLILTLRLPGGQEDETLGSFKRSTVKCQQFEMKRIGVAWNYRKDRATLVKKIRNYYYYYYHHHHHYYYLLQFSCHSVAAVLTPVHTKQIRINIHKRNNTKNRVQTTQNTVNSSTHTTKTHPHTHPHITKPVKTTTAQDTHQMKQSQYNQVTSV
jgi:hypothetical protein